MRGTGGRIKRRGRLWGLGNVKVLYTDAAGRVQIPAADVGRICSDRMSRNVSLDNVWIVGYTKIIRVVDRNFPAASLSRI